MRPFRSFLRPCRGAWEDHFRAISVVYGAISVPFGAISADFEAIPKDFEVLRRNWERFENVLGDLEAFWMIHSYFLAGGRGV